MNDSDRFLKGIVLGATVGAVVALLLAPKSGRQLRADLKNRVDQAGKDAATKADALQSDLGRRADELRNLTKELAGEAKAESDTLITQTEKLKTDLKTAAGNLSRTGRSAKDQAVSELKPLMGEGAALMRELERLTKKLASSAKEKLNQDED